MFIDTLGIEYDLPTDKSVDILRIRALPLHTIEFMDRAGYKKVKAACTNH